MFIPAKDRHALDRVAASFFGASTGVLLGSETPKGFWLTAASVGLFSVYVMLSVASWVAHRRAQQELGQVN
jgi:hypothetical protein